MWTRRSEANAYLPTTAIIRTVKPERPEKSFQKSFPTSRNGLRTKDEPPDLIKLSNLALVEGLRTLEQNGLKSGDDQLVQCLAIAGRQVRKLARTLPLLNGGGDRGA